MVKSTKQKSKPQDLTRVVKTSRKENMGDSTRQNNESELSHHELPSPIYNDASPADALEVVVDLPLLPPSPKDDLQNWLKRYNPSSQDSLAITFMNFSHLLRKASDAEEAFKDFIVTPKVVVFGRLISRILRPKRVRKPVGDKGFISNTVGTSTFKRQYLKFRKYYSLPVLLLCMDKILLKPSYYLALVAHGRLYSFDPYQWKQGVAGKLTDLPVVHTQLTELISSGVGVDTVWLSILPPKQDDTEQEDFGYARCQKEIYDSVFFGIETLIQQATQKATRIRGGRTTADWTSHKVVKP